MDNILRRIIKENRPARAVDKFPAKERKFASFTILNDVCFKNAHMMNQIMVIIRK